MKDFNQNKHSIIKFIQIMLNMFAKFNKKSALLKLNYEAHIINNLSVNMFISINILDSHKIVFNIIKNQTTVNICQNAIINLLVKFKVNYQI